MSDNPTNQDLAHQFAFGKSLRRGFRSVAF